MDGAGPHPWDEAARALESTWNHASTSFSHLQRGAADAIHGGMHRVAVHSRQHVRTLRAQLLASAPPFAAVSLSGKRRKGKVMTPEQEGIFREKLKALTPAELQMLRDMAQASVMKAHKVTDVDGKKTDLLTLAKEVAELKRVHAVGGDEPTLRDKPRWQVNSELPSTELRPGAEKQMLRPWEEEALPLAQVAVGNVFKRGAWWQRLAGGRRDFTFGIYADQSAVAEVLGGDWAGVPPDKVLATQTFFVDVMRNAPALELTVMAVPTRDVPLRDARAGIEARLRDTMAQWGDSELSPAPKPEDEAALQSFLHSFEEAKLQDSGLVARGRLLQGSHLILTAGSQGQLSAEAITRGRLKDRRAVLLGTWRSPHLTAAVLDQFLGDEPLDPAAKARAGAGLLFLTNGFRFTESDALKPPNQYLAKDEDDDDDDEDEGGTFGWPRGERMPAVPEVFSIQDRRERRPLLVSDIGDGVAAP